MTKSQVYGIFYNQEKIQFCKGYELFEEVYEELKDKLKLKRKEEKGIYTLVVIEKGEK